MPANEHLALGDIVKARNQAGQRGLRAARAAQNTDGLAGLDAQINVLQNRLAAALAIGEGNIAELDAAVGNVGQCIFRAGEVSLFVQDFTNSLCTGHAHAHHDEDHRNHHQAHKNAGDIAEQAHEVALGEALRDARLCAQPRQRDHAAEDRRHHDRVVQRHIGFRLNKHAIHGLRCSGKLRALVVLTDKGLDHADRADIFLHAGVQIVVLFEHAVKMLRRVRNNERQRKNQKRHGHDEYHAQLRMDGERQNQGRNEHRRCAHADAQEHLIGHLQIGNVRRQARDKPGRRETVDVGKRKGLDVCEH